MSRSSPSSARRWVWLGSALGLMTAGLVSAQPAPPVPSATPPPGEPAPAPAPGPPPAEEAPPVLVTPPPPVPAPPIQAAEVAPAAPPKAQVVAKPEETELKRARHDVAILQALDKVTADSIRFEAEVGKPVRYKNLIFTVKACERAAPDEPTDDSIAYLTIDSQPVAARGKPTPPARQAFKGWMYASSPSLNPLEHPVYDAWVITCRANAPAVAPAPPPAPARKAAPKPAPAPAPEEAPEPEPEVAPEAPPEAPPPSKT